MGQSGNYRSLAMAAALIALWPITLWSQDLVDQKGGGTVSSSARLNDVDANASVVPLPAPQYSASQPSQPAVKSGADGELHGWLLQPDDDDSIILASAQQTVADADQPATPPVPSANPPAPNARRRAAANQFAIGGSVSSLGGPQAPAAISPNMIGDFFLGSGSIYQTLTSGGGDTGKPGVTTTHLLGTIPAAGGTRRVKISENNSPIPRDRVFFDYNNFQNALYVPGTGTSPGHSTSIQRYMPGFEKTFFDGWTSIDVRAPFASAENPNINSLVPNNQPKSTVFGNMTVTFKSLLVRTDRMAVAGGFGLNVPTASSGSLLTNTGVGTANQSFTLFNDAVHFLPYLGVLLQPTDRLFVTTFVQVDVDANGNRIYDNTLNSSVGRLNDQTLMYVDTSLAYWLYRHPENHYLTGIVPLLEYHFTGSLQKPDLVTTSNGIFQFGSTVNQLSISNLTVGSHFYFGPKAIFTVAGAVPLNQSQNQRQFDGELIVLFNRYF